MGKKVLIIGGFYGNGRNNGGVTAVLRGLQSLEKNFLMLGFSFSYLNSCIVKRKSSSNGKMTIANIHNYFLVRKKLKLQLRQDRPNIVFIHSSIGLALLKDCFLAKKVKIFSKRKIEVIVQIHSADPSSIFTKRTFFKKIIISIINKSVDALVLLSSSILSYISNQGVTSKLFVVPNFTEMHFSRTDFENKIASEKLTMSRINFLYIGNIQKEKGVFDLISAFRQASITSSQLVIAGKWVNDIDKKLLEEQIKITPNLSYVGFVTGQEKEDILRWSQVIILPSYTEGLPVSLIEGITFGDYVIATQVGGIPEFFDSCGDILHPGDILGLKNAIEKISLDKQHLITKQRENYLYSSRFSKEKYVTALSAVFFQVLKQ